MLDRREFVKWVILSSSIVLAPTALVLQATNGGNQSLVKGNLEIISQYYAQFKVNFDEGLFRTGKTSFMTSFIGTYLLQHPQYNQVNILVDDVCKKIGQEPLFDGENVVRSIQADFGAEQLFVFDGWVFAAIEVQLCAMAKRVETQSKGW